MKSILTWIRESHWQFRVGLIMLGLLFLIAVGGLVGTPYAPADLTAGEPLSAPSAGHFFGVDSFGRDQLSRCIQGIQISLGLGLGVTLTAFLIGTPVGILIGYLGGRIDSVISRILDVLFAFPSLLLALVLVAVLGPGVRTAAIALVIIYVPIVARFVRGATMAERTREYVVSARISGTSLARVAGKHILPNIVTSMIPMLTSVFSFVVLAEAALSYLGVGAQPPLASLGKMLSDNQGMIGTANFLIILPCLTLSIIILSLTFVGDGLRETLDPKRVRRPQRVPAIRTESVR